MMGYGYHTFPLRFLWCCWWWRRMMMTMTVLIRIEKMSMTVGLLNEKSLYEYKLIGITVRLTFFLALLFLCYLLVLIIFPSHNKKLPNIRQMKIPKHGGANRQTWEENVCFRNFFMMQKYTFLMQNTYISWNNRIIKRQEWIVVNIIVKSIHKSFKVTDFNAEINCQVTFLFVSLDAGLSNFLPLPYL